MAGSPKKRALKETVSKMGIEPILERIANGETIANIATALGTSAPMLSALLNRAENSDAYARARERRAERHAERIETLADRVESGDIDPQAARVSIDARKWVAARLDPGRWAESKAPLLNITLTDLHANALRKVIDVQPVEIVDETKS